MNTTQKSNISFTAVKQPIIRLPSIRLADRGNVQLGGQGPAFRKASIKDIGNVRLGGQGPIFR